ncbi:MAG: DEDD exonuclease domain-containing protein [Actinobacteria bacterium]|nr:DEDD exonuclease domain-containing protein [Actinomycetota bacterium]
MVVGVVATAQQHSFDSLGVPLSGVTFVVVDLETTGLSPTADRITEIGAVKVRFGEVLGEFHTLVHPGRSIPSAITTVTGITDAMVRGAPAIDAVLPAFLEFARDTVLVAHNARFDVSFLDAELERRGYPRLDHPVVDTAKVARRLLRDEVRDCRLATLARHLKARTMPEHRALADARATVDVLHGLLERAGTLGATTLEDLRDYTRSTTDKAFRKIALVADAPVAPGVYRFLDERGDVLYVGKATELRSRLRTYFGRDPRRRIADMVRDTATVTWTPTPTPLEAAVREVREIHRDRPRYNRRSKNPHAQVYVKLTTERFPRLSVVSGVRDDGALYLGPVGSRKVAERFLDAVHDVLPLRRCTMRIRAAQDHPSCALKDLGRCGAPCDGTQSVDDYAAVVAAFRDIAEHDPAALLAHLRGRMDALAAAGRYERARDARTRLHTTAGILRTARRTGSLAAVPELVARRRDGDADEVVVVRHGRLAASVRVRPGADGDELDEALAMAGSMPTAVGLPGRDDAEEVRLVLAWLDRPDTRIVRATDGWTEPWAGGGVLAATVDEARQVDRALRRDRQVLHDVKVRRREVDAPREGHTISNQGVHASASSA